MHKSATAGLIGLGALAAALAAGRGLFAPDPEGRLIRHIEAAYQKGTPYAGLTDLYPKDETLFPPDLAAPTFRWRSLSLIHISEPTRLGMISYAVFCLKK